MSVDINFVTVFYCYFQVRKLGPGSYEIKDFLESSDLKPRSALGICETRAARFTDLQSEVPGPGIDYF